MITMCIHGGLGNQMFQYAFGRALAKKLGVGLQLDLTYVLKDNIRRYNLPVWAGVKEPTVEGTPVTIREGSYFPYNKNLVDGIKDGDCLSGYWQTEKYFADVREELLSVFVPAQPFTQYTQDLIGRIEEEGHNSTFLTVRRTDYLLPHAIKYHGQMTSDYYVKALDEIRKQVPDPHVFVFSDDPEWCKSNFKLPCRFTVVDVVNMTTPTKLGREDEHLWPMSLCHNAIFANSSFSWWGGWMNQDPGVIVAPKKWFADAPLDTRDIIPERWITI